MSFFSNLIIRPPKQEMIPGKAMPLLVDYRRRPNARRYILRVNERGDGGCVTIPRGGSWAEARRFARRNAAWLEQRLRQHQERASRLEDKIMFRGELLPLTEVFAKCDNAQTPLQISTNGQEPCLEMIRNRVQFFLRKLAERELPLRTQDLALAHGLTVRRVSVRDQRSRWGSCSVKAVISLNWRLVQTPEFVRDYIIVHELMHLREMNHSARFWKLVHEAFPRTGEAEGWLKSNGSLLKAG